MKTNNIWLLLAIIILAAQGCVNLTTRTETDTYTISERDTTTLVEQKNAPGNRDNGVIYPSSRTQRTYRYLYQRDSIVERYYPDFIRIGAFESVGLLGTGAGDNSMGTGLFGVFPDFFNLRSDYDGSKDKVFPGGLYRIGVGEWRLRWFQDAANWTIGTSLIEYLVPNALTEKMLVGVFPLYIRKRYFLREEIPYVAFTPAFGLGYYPSMYLNVSGSIDVGSIGGLNVRGYLGLAAGINQEWTYQVRISDQSGKGHTSIFPYAGIGVSVLDFLNIVPETYKEWKDYQHSSWDVGLLQLGLLSTGADISALSKDSTTRVFSGYLIRLANASVALPILNNQFYLGTSLGNLIVLGQSEWGLGILPFRAGYWQTLIADELTTEPFIEYNYYPSSFFHIGNRVNLRISDFLNVGFILGYASGETTNQLGSDITNEIGKPLKFSRGYLGLTVGFSDRIFFPRDLRYNRK